MLKLPASRADLAALIAGLLLAVEAVGVILLSLAMIAANAGPISAMGVLTLLIGVAMGWGGTVLVGLVKGGGKGLAPVILLTGLGFSFSLHGLMFAGACGINCPPQMPWSVYAVPILLAGFNTACAALLWFRVGSSGL